MRAFLTAGFFTLAATATMASDKIPAAGGDIVITPITHASVQVEHGGKVIQVDPWTKGDLSTARPADIILVTDIHGDHLDPEAIAKVRKPGTPVVLPKAAADSAGDKIPEPKTVIANGEKKTVGGLAIEAVPMYNLVRGPKPGELFHTKGRGNGYVVTVGDKRLYFAGDTECTPEMKALQKIDVAFLPMNLPYTMTPAEAAECAKAFKPAIAYPYHYRDQKPAEFADALKGQNVDVRLLEWYPPAAPGSPK